MGTYVYDTEACPLNMYCISIEGDKRRQGGRKRKKRRKEVCVYDIYLYMYIHMRICTHINSYTYMCIQGGG